jgi:GMP synthase (glutamine-hydrolysing)
LLVRHVPVEGISGFREPVEAAGYAIDRIDVTDPGFADTDFVGPDLVVLMGGPMGVYETNRHPWIVHEIERLRDRLAANRPTLGVCLGAQLVAAALGAAVYPGPKAEIGFSPIALSEAGQAGPLRHLDGCPVLHWHGDTFDLPAGTELLASSGLYARQAFRRGDAVLALQFHAEMGLDPRFESWIADNPAALAALGLTPAELRRAYADLGPRAVTAGRRMIADWLSRLG